MFGTLVTGLCACTGQAACRLPLEASKRLRRGSVKGVRPKGRRARLLLGLWCDHAAAWCEAVHKLFRRLTHTHTHTPLLPVSQVVKNRLQVGVGLLCLLLGHCACFWGLPVGLVLNGCMQGVACAAGMPRMLQCAGLQRISFSFFVEPCSSCRPPPPFDRP